MQNLILDGGYFGREKKKNREKRTSVKAKRH